MKMMNSKDGVLRATINIPYRVSNIDLEIIAFVKDYDEDDSPSPKLRKATRKEVIEAIESGYFAIMDWHVEEIEVYYELVPENKYRS